MKWIILLLFTLTFSVEATSSDICEFASHGTGAQDAVRSNIYLLRCSD